MPLFSPFILRRLIREPLRSATTVLGVALGVSVIVAIQITKASSLAGFETALETVAGRASLEVVSAGPGVDERLLSGVGWLREYGAIAPILEGDAVYAPAAGPAERLHVLGVDALRDRPFRDDTLVATAGGAPTQDLLGALLDPSSVVLAQAFAEAHGLAVGSAFTVRIGDRAVPLTVRGLLANEGPARVLDGRFALMDIAAAQQAFDRFGFIDRLEIQIADAAAIDADEAAIARRLPPGLTVERPARRGRQVEQMLAAFHLNLTALSYVALVVGLFLVYNTVAVAVLARREEIGILRALGVRRAGIRRLFLGEAALVAVVGCALGVGLGRVLADGTIALTATTVSTLYIAAAAAPPALGWREVLLAFGTGVPLSLLAAAVPAREAGSVPPIAAIRGADRVAARGARPRRAAAIGASLLALGAWFATRGPVAGLPVFGYLSAAALIFGAALIVPALLAAVARLRRLPARWSWTGRVEDWLAVTNLAAAVPRLSISVAALAVSLSMMVAIAIMIGSFRETVVYWAGQTLRADLFLSPGTGEAPGRNGTLSPDVVRIVRDRPEVAGVDPYRIMDVPFDGTRVRVAGRAFDVLLAHGGLLFKAPADGGAALRDAAGGNAVAVSEAFAIKHGYRVGDTVPVPTPAGPVPCRVAAVYYDYSSDRGVLLMDRTTFARLYGAGGPNGISVYLAPGADPDRVRASLLDAIGPDRAVFINTNRSLHAEVLRIFDSTFAITSALELVAIIVAMLGVSGTLLTVMLERAGDIAILRQIGTTRRQIRRMVVVEAMLVGAVSQGIGLVVGFGLSLILIDVVNVQSFGWTIQFHLPAAFLLQSSAAMIVATGLAGLYPARRAARRLVRHEE